MQPPSTRMDVRGLTARIELTRRVLGPAEDVASSSSAAMRFEATRRGLELVEDVASITNGLNQRKTRGTSPRPSGGTCVA